MNRTFADPVGAVCVDGSAVGKAAFADIPVPMEGLAEGSLAVAAVAADRRMEVAGVGMAAEVWI